MTYEERVEIEKTDNQRIKDLILEVIKKLGYSSETDSEYSQINFKATKEDHTLYFRTNYFMQKRRICISGGYPRQSNGSYVSPYGYGEKQDDKITVSAEKSADQIVRDIKNRLLPAYENRLEKVKAEVERQDNYENLKKKTLQSLAEEAGKEPETSGGSIYLDCGEGYLTAKVSGYKVYMSLHSISAETAKKIIGMIKKSEKAVA